MNLIGEEAWCRARKIPGRHSLSLRLDALKRFARWNQEDFNAPVLLPPRLGFVVADRLVLPLPCCQKAVAGDAGLVLKEPYHRGGAGRREFPVGWKLIAQ